MSRPNSRPSSQGRINHVVPLKEPPKINQEALQIAKETVDLMRPFTSAGIDSRERFSRRPLKHLGGVTPVNAKRKFQKTDAREVWSLAHKHRLPIDEVQRIAHAISSMKTDLFGRLGDGEIRKLLCRAFDVEDISDDFMEEAVQKLTLDGEEVTLDGFVSWYVQNMFKHVTGLLGAKDKCASNAFVSALAKKFGVDTCVIDKIKKDFDRFDTDGSGTLEEEEFKRVLYCVFQAKEGDLSDNRLRHFWMEIDSDKDGQIEFAEYVKWYLKYFNPATSTCSLADSFYDSFNPGVQRRKNLHVAVLEEV